MTISSINMGMNASSWGAYNQKLTNETRNKLDELGIPYSNSTTESQAQNLIKAKEAEKNKGAEAFSQNQSGDNSLFAKAKELAKKLGISYKEDVQFEELMNIIENTLKSEVEGSANKGEIPALLEACLKEFSLIKAESNQSLGLQNDVSQNLMASLEMLGQYNKNMLFN